MGFKGKHIISIDDFTKKNILHVLKIAKKMTKMTKPIFSGYVMGTLFFEPSTRTRLSHEAAMTKLGGHVIGFAEPDSDFQEYLLSQVQHHVHLLFSQRIDLTSPIPH